MPQNQAAWLKSKFETFVVSDAPYTPPSVNQIVIRNGAVAINPVDRIIHKLGGFIYGWLTYPFILGVDLAGEVVEVGEGVTRFKAGDRVLAHAVGIEKSRNRASESAFQLYTVVPDHMAAPIPLHLSYENACVLPLGLSTAACGLFQKDQLALRYPSVSPEETGETVLVWGGSTSVGSNAIQLAVAAGYKVVTTASPRNFEYVRGLGASQAFDYNSSTVVEDICNSLRGQKLAGAISIGAGSALPCIAIVKSAEGRKFVSMASFPVEPDALPHRPSLPTILARMVLPMLPKAINQTIKAALGGVKTKAIWGSSLMDNEVSRIVYADFLPRALEAGTYHAAPGPLVIGNGLSLIQEAFEIQKKGVSAQKVVVLLP